MNVASQHDLEAFARDFTGACKVTEGAESLLLLLSPDGTILDLNQPMANVLGKEAPQLRGKLFWSQVPAESGSAMQALVRRVVQDRRSSREDANVGGRWYDCRWTPRLNGAGNVNQLVMLAWDITEREQADEALRESENRYQRLLEVESDAILVVDRHTGKFLDANTAATGLYGFSRQEFLTMEAADVSTTPDETRHAISDGFAQARLRWHRKKDGTVFPVEINGTFFSNQKRDIHIAAIRDLTQRMREETALRQSEERFRAYVQQSSDAIMTIAPPDWRFRSGNPATIAMFRAKDEADLLSRNPWDVSPEKQPDGRLSSEKARAMVDRAMHQGSYSFEWTHCRLDGEVFPAEVLLTRFELQGKTIVQATLRDITERKRAEAALREKEQSHQAVLQTAMDGFCSVDLQGRVLEVNEALTRMHGYTKEEFLRMRVSDIESVETPDKTAARIADILVQKQQRFETKHRRKDGTIFDVEVSVQYQPETPGQIFSFFRDITERKSLEERLRQAQKMEGIGQLAGGVAHDFNNILASTMLHLGLLKQNPNLDNETQQSLEELIAGSQKAANLTRQLLMFSRRSVLDIKALDLNDVVANLLKMLTRLIGEHIRVQFEPNAGLPLVAADPGMVEQVLMNLCVNARDAMPNGGRIAIKLEVDDVDEGRTRAQAGARPGRFVCLSVADTGCGMDKATLQRIFEPFFTTKEPGKGTGLGLATVHGIAGQHKGWVEVESKVGEGTVFRVLLPAASERTIEATRAEKRELLKGHETILLVEDEAGVRRVMAHGLRLLGYRVLEAGDGQEALQAWNEPQNRVDLLLTDVVMPGGMTGVELAEKLRAVKPGLPVVICSGYSAEMASHGFPKEKNFVRLDKPYRFEALSTAIRQCLERQ
jgi:PAS domain S-box-containing protein